MSVLFDQISIRQLVPPFILIHFNLQLGNVELGKYCKRQGTVGSSESHSEAMKSVKQPAAAQKPGNWRQ